MIKNDVWLKENAERLGINPANANPSSVDLVLGGQITVKRNAREFCLPFDSISDGVELAERDGYTLDPRIPGGEWLTKTLDLPDGYEFIFHPGRFYICHSAEVVTIPSDTAAFLYLKSSAGRKGLEHSHAGFFDPGFTGQAVFELTCHIPVVLPIGAKIAQLVYLDCERPERDYSITGRYGGQRGAQEAL